MKHLLAALVAACLLGLQLLNSTASAQSAASRGVTTTPDNQILVELVPEDITPANPFDLNRRSVIFVPDGQGGYSRSVRSVAWEDDIGPAVGDGSQIPLHGFTIDFGGHRWESFFVSRLGLITFGEPFTYSPPSYSPGFETMSQIADRFVMAPTISLLYKPLLGGAVARQHVASSADRIVVTWITTEPHYYVHGAPPAKPSRFQLVLGADGSIRFSYLDMAIRDGIVGLFPGGEAAKGAVVASIPDERADTELPGHLDLLDASIYESNIHGKVIAEWTTREEFRGPRTGTQNLYRLLFDMGDHHFQWLVGALDDGSHWTRGGERLETANPNRIALLVDISSLGGLPARFWADVGEFTVGGDPLRVDRSREAQITLPTVAPEVDLSRPDRAFSGSQSEVFHYRGVREIGEIACRVIEVLGDRFDLFTFHSEFRVDYQESASDWRRFREDIRGIGSDLARREPSPCGEGRLKGHWKRPVWMKADSVFVDPRLRDHPEETGFERGLLLFAHEFTHHWTSWASFRTGGQVESLAGDPCRCHWRWELHAPAAFPWYKDDPGARSLMGGRYWRRNSDGTFTPLDGYWGGGHSWLDLYMMGLAEASEVPNMFVMRNLRSVDGGGRWGPHTGDKEVVSIEQVVAAEGPRVPPASDAQKNFNAAFVYLLEPGRTPDPAALRLHAEHLDKVIEHWSHVTGGRSRVTARVPGVANRSPVVTGTLADQVVRVGGAVAVDVGRAFRDPDGDPLTYVATSSARAVASVAVLGSTVTVTPASEGTTTVTVTATDAGGSNGTAAQTFAVTVRPAGGHRFTDDPIVPGVTPVRAVHFTEVRVRIDILRREAGLAPFRWTDPVLLAGVTPVRLVHLTELRSALAEAYGAAGRAISRWTDASPSAGSTSIRAAHLTELRAAVLALEREGPR